MSILRKAREYLSDMERLTHVLIMTLFVLQIGFYLAVARMFGAF